MSTIEIVVLIGIIYLITVNAASRLYFNHGNHSWSRYGYEEYCIWYGIVYASNKLASAICGLVALAFIIEWIK